MCAARHHEGAGYRASAAYAATVGLMWDADLARAAGGAVMEAAGTVLRNRQLADRGRMEQFTSLRRRQVRLAKASLASKTPADRMLRVLRRPEQPSGRRG